MSSCWRIFWLELTSLWRSRTTALLAVCTAIWVVASSQLVRGDGTVQGAQEMALKYSLGGAMAILAVTMLITGAGTIAKEREEKRLQLTVVRPIRYLAVVLGKVLALSMTAMAVLALAVGVYLALVPHGTLSEGGCSHVLRPVLPSPQEEARAMYEVYMNDPDTPVEVKRAPKKTVLRLLTQRAVDHYQTIGPKSTAEWRFKLKPEYEKIAVRLRLTNLYDQRRQVTGELRFGEATGAVSNITQAICVFGLEGKPTGEELELDNRGEEALMLRPRKDVEVLAPADGFKMNLLRAYLELSALLVLLIAFAVSLSAALGRPVAVFVAVVTLVLAEMSPSVIEQYPDELETDKIDAIGLFLTRIAAEVTHPVSGITPLEKLADHECVEWPETLRTLSTHAILLPGLLLLLASFILPKKQ